MDPGDVFIMNYPYWSGTHTLDVLLFAPVFHDEELIGYTTCRAHWLDLGAKDSGYVLDSTDVHQEGVLFPGTKVYKGGEPDPEIMDIIRFNSRMPEKVVGDLNAQVAAVRTGEQRLQELYEKYGADTVETAVDKILDHGEQTARAAVEELPDGTWSATGYADGIHRDDDDLIKLHAEVTIDGDEFAVDFSGSSPRWTNPEHPAGDERDHLQAHVQDAHDARRGLQRRPVRAADDARPRGQHFQRELPRADVHRLDGHRRHRRRLQGAREGDADRVPASSGATSRTSCCTARTRRPVARSWRRTTKGVGWGAGVGHDGANALMHISETMVRNIPWRCSRTRRPSGSTSCRCGGLGRSR